MKKFKTGTTDIAFECRLLANKLDEKVALLREQLKLKKSIKNKPEGEVTLGFGDCGATIIPCEWTLGVLEDVITATRKDIKFWEKSIKEYLEGQRVSSSSKLAARLEAAIIKSRNGNNDATVLLSVVADVIKEWCAQDIKESERAGQ